jgi:hypothetical protein
VDARLIISAINKVVLDVQQASSNALKLNLRMGEATNKPMSGSISSLAVMSRQRLGEKGKLRMDVIIVRLKSTRRNTAIVMTLNAGGMAGIIGRAIMVVAMWISTIVHSNINLPVADLEKERGLKK